jgi:large conductance mechanosensitive channel
LFKAFAMGGSMLDLALGFIIGTAFAGLVDSLAADLVMQLVAAIFGQPGYGAFLTVLVHFLLLAAVLLALVELLERIGLGNFRAQGSRECPHCKEFVAIDATRCKYCTAEITPVVVDDEDEAPQITTEKRVAE